MPGTCPSCGGVTTGHTIHGDRITVQPCGCPITMQEARRLTEGPSTGDDDPPAIRADGGEIDLEVGDEIRLSRTTSEAFTFEIEELDDTTVEFADGDVTERDSLEADLRDGRYLELVDEDGVGDE